MDVQSHSQVPIQPSSTGLGNEASIYNVCVYCIMCMRKWFYLASVWHCREQCRWLHSTPWVAGDKPVECPGSQTPCSQRKDAVLT